MEGILDVSNPHTLPGDEDPDHVEPVLLTQPAVPVDPDGGGPGQVLLFLPVDSSERPPKVIPVPRLHLNECHQAVAFGDDVDVPVAGSVPLFKVISKTFARFSHEPLAAKSHFPGIEASMQPTGAGYGVS